MLSTATPVVKVTPTQQEKTADELMTTFNLKGTPGYENRTFDRKTIDGVEYLVDGYNNVPKVVNENGTWRELDYHNAKDAEVMYGALAPVGGGIYKDGTYAYGYERFSSQDPNSLLIAPNFTGDWEVIETQYKGETIHLYNLLTALRDADGMIHVVRLAWDSPDVTPIHLSQIGCEIKDSNDTLLSPGAQRKFAAFMLADALPVLPVGRPVGASVWKNPPPVFEFSSLDIGDNDSLHNTEQQVLMAGLLAADPAAYSLSAAEYAASLADGSWPSKTVTLALDRGPSVMGKSFLDCFASVNGWRSASQDLDEIK